MRIFRFTTAARNRSLRIMQYVTAILLASAIVLAGSNVANSRESKPEVTSRQQTREPLHPAPSTQTVYAPGGLKRFSQAEIVLNNNSPDNKDVAAVFYNAEGTAVTGRTVTLKPTEVRSMKLADLMLPDHPVKKKMAGMTLTYFGGMMEVGAQITLPGAHGAGSVDMPFSGVMDYHSSIQEGVWWMPKGSVATIILGNAAEARIVASLKYANGESQDLSLGPFSTEIVERRSDETSAASGAAESVRLELSGPVGSLRATGFVTSADNGFSSSIRFYDPKAIRQPNLFATNLRLKKSKPHMVLKNIGDGVISARPRFIPLAGESGNGLELSTLSLEPHQTIEVDLEPLRKAAKARSDFDMVSVQVVNDSGANNLIGALYSTDSRTATTYDVPLRDSGPVGHSTGSYPWRLDGDYSSIISISNTRDSASKYLVTINYDSGRYSLNPKALAAGETAVFDLRNIRDEQVPDKDGNTIPQSVGTGQFRWSLIGDDTSRLIGRSEVVSPLNRVSSSYSCPVCCPNSFAGFEFNPSSSAGPVGGTAILAVDGFYVDCSRIVYGPYAVSPYGLWVEYPSVLSIAMISNGSAQMGCLSLGQSRFGGFVDGTWYDNDGMDCYSRDGPFGGEGNGAVVCAIPVNFRKTAASNAGGGVLHFEYKWDSNTGHLADLSQCSVGEKVDYNAAELPFASPPFPPINPQNPTIRNVGGADGALQDNHATAGNFVKPYVAASVTASQIYRYSCPCHNAGAFETLLGPHDIVRSVSQKSNGKWKFTITKTGSSAKIDPLP